MLKVFLADDSQLVRDRLKEIFAEKGTITVVGESGNAKEAILAIQQSSPEVVILDIRMPGGGGLPVLHDIKRREPDTTVIVLTSYPYPQYRQAYLAAGASYFFDKTEDIQRVGDVLVELAQQYSGTPKKKILMLGDNPAIIKVAQLAIEHGREVVTIFSNPPSPAEAHLVTEPYDLIVLVLCAFDTQTVIARVCALLGEQVGRVPLLIISHQAVESDGFSKIYHLDFPFTKNELGAQIREILHEDLTLFPAVSRAQTGSVGSLG